MTKRRDETSSIDVNVAPGANLSAQDIVGRDKITTNLNLSLSLTDPSILFSLISRHWLFLLATFILQTIAVILWLHYADRFLISVWVLLTGMGLLEAILVGGYTLKQKLEPPRRFALLTAVPLLALAGLIGFEYWRAAYPVPFEAEVFGVAVAQFGEGPDLHITPQSREVSDLVLGQLEKLKRENPDDLQFVQFKSIGLVHNQQEALEDGLRVKADLVIWGQLQVSEVATSLNFVVLETPDKASNPDFPRVVPIIEPATTGVIEIPSRKSEEIAENTKTIAAFTFGLAHFFKSDFKGAVLAFQEASQTSSAQANSYLVHLYYGLSLQMIGDLEGASEQLKLAALLSPKDPAAPLGLAFGYRSLGRVEEAQAQAHLAIDLCTQRLQLRPDDELAFYDRALADEILEDWELALADYGEAVNHNTNLYVARLSQIRMLIALKRQPEAIQAGRQSVEFAKKNGANPAWAYLYLALAYQNDGNSEEARLAYQNAIELAPEVDWIHHKAAQFYEMVNEWDAAQAEYEAALKVSNTPAGAHAELGDFFVRTGQLDASISEYQAALRINPNVSGILILLADVYNRQGKTDEALKNYDKAVKAEPGNFDAHVAYGGFLYTHKDLVGAIEQWAAASVINPNNCNLLINLGVAYEVLGATADAREVYTRALSLGIEPGSDCHVIAQEKLDHLPP